MICRVLAREPPRFALFTIWGWLGFTFSIGVIFCGIFLICPVESDDGDYEHDEHDEREGAAPHCAMELTSQTEIETDEARFTSSSARGSDFDTFDAECGSDAASERSAGVASDIDSVASLRPPSEARAISGGGWRWHETRRLVCVCVSPRGGLRGDDAGPKHTSSSSLRSASDRWTGRSRAPVETRSDQP